MTRRRNRAFVGIACVWLALPHGCGDGTPLMDADLPDSRGDASEESEHAPVLTSCGEGEAPWVPYLDGVFRRVYTPPGTRYLNDHTIVRGADGLFHLYGITEESPVMPFDERNLLHAVASSLHGPWSPRPDILRAEAPENVLWAPFAFERSPGQWTMYYWGQTSDQMIRRADSVDLDRWTRVDSPVPGGRDPFVMRVGDHWFIYSVGARPTGDGHSNGQIVLATSTDLVHWSEPVTVVQDPDPSFIQGNLESPTVVAWQRGYYLFVTRTGEDPIAYMKTFVLYSDDPTHFAWSPVTEIQAHAAEVLTHDGSWFITSAGWTANVGERWRGLSLARLGWTHRCAR